MATSKTTFDSRRPDTALRQIAVIRRKRFNRICDILRLSRAATVLFPASPATVFRKWACNAALSGSCDSTILVR